MAFPATYKNADPDDNVVRSGKSAVILLGMPDARYITGGTWVKASGVFCTLDDAAAVPMSPIGEQEIMWIGKRKSRINEGVQIDPFDISLKGNSQGVLFAMANIDVGTNGQVAFRHEYEFNRDFFLIKHAYSLVDTQRIQRSTYIGSLAARVLEIPADSPGSETKQMVQFYSSDATDDMPIDLQPGKAWAAEVFYDNGVVGGIVNAAAPDGSILTFQLGDGNGSFATSITPAAQIIDVDYAATHPRRWFAGLWVNGVSILDDTNVTFVTATNTITFASSFAPADGARLVAVYAVDLATNPTHLPNSYQGPNPTDPQQIGYGWNAIGNL